MDFQKTQYVQNMNKGSLENLIIPAPFKRHLVQIFDSFIYLNRLYIIYEYFENGNLSDLVGIFQNYLFFILKNGFAICDVQNFIYINMDR